MTICYCSWQDSTVFKCRHFFKHKYPVFCLFVLFYNEIKDILKLIFECKNIV